MRCVDIEVIVSFGVSFLYHMKPGEIVCLFPRFDRLPDQRAQIESWKIKKKCHGISRIVRQDLIDRIDITSPLL